MLDHFEYAKEWLDKQKHVLIMTAADIIKSLDAYKTLLMNALETEQEHGREFNEVDGKARFSRKAA